jgi:hypothetical protein
VGYISRASNNRTRLTWVRVAACLFLLVVPGLSAWSAQSGKSKSKQSPAKQSAIAGRTGKAAAVSGSAEKVPADPVICAKPGDADAARAGVEGNPSGAARPATESEPPAESGSDANVGYAKDKLKLSLGGKSAPEQPQQCGVDEAESQK